MQDTMFLLRQPSPHRMILQYHPQIGHLFVPNLSARIPSETGGYHIRTNAQGFRADVDFTPQHGERPRILFLGDSFTAGDGVANADRFSERVGAALNAEVYNLAVSGTGTDQQVLIYEQFASDIEADLIVFCVNVVNIARNKLTHRESVDRTTGERVMVPKPYFTLEDGELVRGHNPVPLERPLVPDEGESSGGTMDKLKQVYNHPSMAPLRDLYRKSGLRGTVKRAIDPYPDYADENSEGWQLMAALIRRLVAAAGDTPVLLVPVPSTAYYRDGAEATFQPRFASLAGENTLVMNLTEPLRELSADVQEQLTFAHDRHHLSAYGHGVVAEILSAQVAEVLKQDKPESLPDIASTKPEGRYILGVSAFYHNSAAALIRDGEIVAAAEEERFTRVKNDRGFPARAVNYCLEAAGIQPDDLEAVVYYDNAYLTFERLMQTQLALGDAGEEAWRRVLPSWVSYKLHIPRLIREALKYDGQILHGVHHRSHAASAFYPSPFEEAAIVTVDGVGEWATATIGYGKGEQVEILKEMHFPHSIGLLYSAFTQFTGFKVNNGEYKMMGLAPYGDPVYVDAIYEHLIDVSDDGAVTLNMDYFDFLGAPRMTNEKFAELFGGAPRDPNERITKRERDMARSIQIVTEDIILLMAAHAHALTGAKYLCLAGGVALNCVANGRILREGPFEDIWIQPAAGDSGCALGVALDAHYAYFGAERTLRADGRPGQGGSYWGPSYSDNEIRAFVETHGYPYTELNPADRGDTLAGFIEAGKVIGHFDGRLEYGPRALGSRSIIGDARSQEMQTTINLKIKYRESFRPFAPAVLAEDVSDYFELDRESPYMLIVADVVKERRLPFERGDDEDMLEVVRRPRSDIPAITHVDYSARIQTIQQDDHRTYYDLINAFKARTGTSVIVNTSFNVRGEPIVCTPYDAYRCFMRTEMDVLVMGNVLLYKEQQPDWNERKGHDEHDSPATKPAEHPLAAPLAEVFTKKFQPILSKYPVDLVTQGAGWHSVTDSANRAQFEIPAALDTSEPDAEAMASAILAQWQRTTPEVRGALQAVVGELLTVGLQAQSGKVSEEAETVSEAVYVMY